MVVPSSQESGTAGVEEPGGLNLQAADDQPVDAIANILLGLTVDAHKPIDYLGEVDRRDRGWRSAPQERLDLSPRWLVAQCANECRRVENCHPTSFPRRLLPLRV